MNQNITQSTAKMFTFGVYFRYLENEDPSSSQTSSVSNTKEERDSSLNKTFREINSTQISISSDTDNDEDRPMSSTQVSKCDTSHEQDIFSNRTRYRYQKFLNIKISIVISDHWKIKMP